MTLIDKAWVDTNCPNHMTEISIPEGFTDIDELAFQARANLVSIILPTTIRRIGPYAFHGCTSLTSVNIPAGLTTIEGSTFSECRSLASITIPNSVTTIEIDAFFGCAFKNITIPNSVTTLGPGVFYECFFLETINLSEKVGVIEDNTFMHCASLKVITIPNSVTAIGRAAFSFCASLTTITIPNSVTSIGEDAFNMCKSLYLVTAPQDLDLTKANLHLDATVIRPKLSYFPILPFLFKNKILPRITSEKFNRPLAQLLFLCINRISILIDKNETKLPFLPDIAIHYILKFLIIDISPLRIGLVSSQEILRPTPISEEKKRLAQWTQGFEALDLGPKKQ